ncbi:MAG: NAD-dependent epimerase/dehydratase family protein [Flavobacteriales bacterium]
MNQILITGGAGHIGGRLARKLVENPLNKVVIVDNLSTGSRDNLPSDHFKNWVFVNCDVNSYEDLSAVMLGNKFRFVFHLAAVVGVQRTQQYPIKVLDDIQGIKNVLSLSKNTSVERVFYSSSSEVYGETVEFPQNERTTPLNARVPYAAVKNVGEAYVKSYQKIHGLDYTIFRFFNTYGPEQSVDFVIPRFMHLAKANRDILIYGDGQQTRTFLHVDDNVAMCVKAMEDQSLVNEVVNIGGSEEITILNLARLIIKLSASNSKIVHIDPLEEGDMTRRVPDNQLMKKCLQKELLSLEDGLKLMIGNIAGQSDRVAIA